MEELLTAKQVAKAMGFDRMTILDWAKKGLFPSIKLSTRKVRFSPKDVEAWINSKKREVR